MSRAPAPLALPKGSMLSRCLVAAAAGTASFAIIGIPLWASGNKYWIIAGLVPGLLNAGNGYYTVRRHQRSMAYRDLLRSAHERRVVQSHPDYPVGRGYGGI